MTTGAIVVTLAVLMMFGFVARPFVRAWWRDRKHRLANRETMRRLKEDGPAPTEKMGK